jgi:hypothetical protein
MTSTIATVAHATAGVYSLEADADGDVAVWHTLDPEQPERKTRMDMPLSVLFGLTDAAICRLNICSIEATHRYDEALRRPAKVVPIRSGVGVVAVPVVGRVS